MIVKWPGVTKPSSTAEQYVIIEDFFPTILEMARLKDYKTVQHMDGKSFVPVLKNPDYIDKKRALYWHIPNKWIPADGPGINYRSAVRQGDWKLIFNMRDGSRELYNLKTDIGELKNLVSEYPEQAKVLLNQLGDWLKQNNAPMPLDKKTGKGVPFPVEY